MADQNQPSQEKTEPPTQKRKDEARKKGQVPRSRELNTMLSLLFVASGFVVVGGWMAAEFPALLSSALSFDRETAFDKNIVAVRFVEMVMASLRILSPLFAFAILGALAGPLMMGGWSFSTSALAFKAEKINPLKGLKRVFSVNGLMELFKALSKFLVLSAVTIVLFSFVIDELLFLGNLEPIKAFAESASILRWSLLVLSFAMILIVVFDVPFQLWNHNKQLKMTRQEVLDEMKETDGRPEVRNRIRNLQREVSQRRTMEATSTADVVITNPQHFAVALKYDAEAGGAPVVLAKGRDLVAQKMREVAAENNVPIYEAPPLARALYSATEIGSQIPENLFVAVAKVLAYIYQLRTSRRNEYTPRPDDITVPEEYRGLYKTELDDDE